MNFTSKNKLADEIFHDCLTPTAPAFPTCLGEELLQECLLLAWRLYVHHDILGGALLNVALLFLLLGRRLHPQSCPPRTHPHAPTCRFSSARRSRIVAPGACSHVSGSAPPRVEPTDSEKLWRWKRLVLTRTSNQMASSESSSPVASDSASSSSDLTMYGPSRWYPSLR